VWFQALFHSPPGGAFHLSLTVLVRYRSHESLSPWRVVPPASRPIPRVGRYSGTPLRRPVAVIYRAVTVSGPPFQGSSTGCSRRVRGSYNPGRPKSPGLGLGPFRSPLLRASRLIPLPPGTEMFQFPGFASPSGDDGARAPPGFPIRPSRAHSLCAAPPSLSQLTAAFLAFVCPGIPHTPSLA
jgi:hypothetical protein